MSFGRDIEKFKNKTEEAATKIFRGTSLNLFGKILKRTPVDTGRLRGNWYSSINTPSKTVDGSGEGFEQTTDRAKLGDSLYLVNNLPYAKAIEDGHSQRQAPIGMVKITILEFEHIVAQQARKYNK